MLAESIIQNFDVIIVSGPTCSGKSSLALKLAQKINGEIINMDSLQVYKGMDIGTAKPSTEDFSKVPHHLYDIINPDESFDVAKYLKLAKQKIDELKKKQTVPIFVGGTTLYAKTLINGISDLPKVDEELRAELSEKNLAQLQAQLDDLDPSAKDQIDFANPRRVQRAVEIITTSGCDLKSAYQKSKVAGPLADLKVLVLVLNPNREGLRASVRKRVEEMLANGLIAEVKMILEAYGQVKPLESVGYAESLNFIAGELSESDLLEQIATHTMQYAKRQSTFWRNEPNKHKWQVIKDNRASFTEALSSQEQGNQLCIYGQKLNKMLKSNQVNVINLDF